MNTYKQIVYRYSFDGKKMWTVNDKRVWKNGKRTEKAMGNEQERLIYEVGDIVKLKKKLTELKS